MAGKKASRDEYLSKRKGSIGKGSLGQETVFKGFAAPASYDADKRSADFVMSSEAIDRDGDIVRQKGLAIDRFKENPQALLFHKSNSWPVGQWSDVKTIAGNSPRTEGTLNFLPAGGPVPDVDQAHWMVQHGALRTVSIGFMPLDLELIEHKDGTSPFDYGFDILASELYECSLVPVPAQPDAVAKGMINSGEMSIAKEFIEQALDEWARDPRTQMLVPKKRLAAVYRKHFGGKAMAYMAVDAMQPDPAATALVKLMKTVAEADLLTKDGAGGLRIVGPDGQPIDTSDPAEGDEGEIEAISGIEIEFPITVNLTVNQSGTTGAVTRTGNDTGDQASGAGEAVAGQQSGKSAGLIARAFNKLFGGPSNADEQAEQAAAAEAARKQHMEALEVSYDLAMRRAKANDRAAAIEARMNAAKAA